jgi:hypothetical protein
MHACVFGAKRLCIHMVCCHKPPHLQLTYCLPVLRPNLLLLLAAAAAAVCLRVMCDVSVWVYGCFR